jgi:hypothetical protein
MVEGGDGTGLALEALAMRRAQHLDCDRAAEARVRGLIDLAHAPSAQTLEKLVRAEARSWGGGHTSVRRFYRIHAAGAATETMDKQQRQ